MKVSNNHGIDISIDKYPTLITDYKGKRRGDDSINIVINNVSEYDTDLMPNEDTIVISLSNEDALKLIRQLAVLIGKNVDKSFMRIFPGVAPF